MRTHRYLWALAAALLASCADYGAPDEVTFGAAVYTQPSALFTATGLDAYYLDTVATVVEDDPKNPGSIDLTNPYYSGLVATIDGNMRAYGYSTKLTTPPAQGTANAVVLKLALMRGSAAVYYPGYWCDYWYYYSCYYDWSYAGSYNYGTVFLTMSDFPARNGGKLTVEWLAAMYGVATSATYDVGRISSAIDRAYSQSPYLGTR